MHLGNTQGARAIPATILRLEAQGHGKADTLFPGLGDGASLGLADLPRQIEFGVWQDAAASSPSSPTLCNLSSLYPEGQGLWEPPPSASYPTLSRGLCDVSEKLMSLQRIANIFSFLFFSSPLPHRRPKKRQSLSENRSVMAELTF